MPTQKHENLCLSALFEIVKTWMQLNYHSEGEWINPGLLQWTQHNKNVFKL